MTLNAMPDNFQVDLLLLRRVQGLSPSSLVEIQKKEGEEPYFPDWINNDLSRDAELTADIMDHTLGFGVARTDGTVIQKFKDLDAAEKARTNARISFDVSVDVAGEQNGEEE